jgi:membrane fusion protein (multidrug efflux system)
MGDQWVVTGGLKPGEAVIVDNLIRLRPGVRVEPKAAASAPAPGVEPTAAPVGAPAPARP